MQRFIFRELKYGARNYSPLEVVLKKGRGIYLTDVEDKVYMDFLSGYSAVNQGHCHPRILQAFTEQAGRLTLTSRAFYNDKLGEFMEMITRTFGYEKMLPMNTGVEAGETAIKLSRNWGYVKKGVEPNKAVNIFCRNNFWGRSLAACSSSTDPDCYRNYGPYTQGFEIIDYNSAAQLEEKFKLNPNIVSFMLEPIQGEAGVIVPDAGYLTAVRELCTKYNVLMIADEVQTGLCRTGEMLACDYEDVRPDLLVLGKALSGGFMPVSVVLADATVMDVMKPGTHGSTFGGNPLAAVVGMAALNVLIEEKLAENSMAQGEYFRSELRRFDNADITDVRGKGLLNAIEFTNDEVTTKFCHNLMENGLLCKMTHGNIIRFSPPLVITREQIDIALDIMRKSL